MLTDPIADMLTRIRNAGRVGLTLVSMPESRMRREIARVLKESGFVLGYESDQADKKPTLTVELRYTGQNEHMIEGIERVSRPGRRVYVGSGTIPRVRNGLGIAIISTPRGVLSDKEAREARVGGEFLAQVW